MNSSPSTIWLQGVGSVNAKPVQDFRRDDIMVFNYGVQYRVLSCVQITPTLREVEMIMVSTAGQSLKPCRARYKSTSLKAFAI